MLIAYVLFDFKYFQVQMMYLLLILIYSFLIKIHYFRDSSPVEDDVVFKPMPSVEDREAEEDYNYDQETFDDDVSKESINDNYDEEVSA